MSFVRALTLAALQPERVDERGQRRRLLPSTGVVQEVPVERRTPVLQHANERAASQMRRDMFLQRERYPTPSSTVRIMTSTSSTMSGPFTATERDFRPLSNSQ